MYCTRPPAVRGENKFACQHACKSVVRAALPRSRQRARLLVQARVSIAAPPKLRNAEQAILDAAAAVKGRGSNGITPQLAATMDDAIAVLEADRGVRAPTASGPLLDGRWRLIFTKPGTPSPIQRGFTSVDAFNIYQEIQLDDATQPARVNNIVDFGRWGVLKVMAEANTDTRPIPGFVPRRGAGFKFLGTSVNYPPAAKDIRIDFAFDNAYFDLAVVPFRIPYPVPFKLLGDETKGWIDVTYLSPDGAFRISRGNKGTIFVLIKDQPPRDRLVDALDRGADDTTIMSIIDTLQATPGASGIASPAGAPEAQGTWRLRWSQQAEDANPLQKALAGNVKNYQVVYDNGRLDNLVEFAPFLKLRASAACAPISPTRTSVNIDGVQVELGGIKIPLQGVQRQQTDGGGYIDWLYLDEGLRVTQGNKGSLFVHTREEGV